ncbi:MAG: right-handed parallel beta-helix repeat-containing protein, partial [Sedimentisphaerales bacterium]|nr:right-handed parallel beta-helix repeat-containing protein [Sedimentisphaerales bacterium]
DAYTSLQTALDDNAADLVTAGNNVVFHCRRDDEVTNDGDTATVYFSGWTTGAANDIVIEYDGSPLDAGAYHLHVAENECININEDYVTLRGLYLYTTSYTDVGDVLWVGALEAANAILIDRCVIRGPNDDTYKHRGVYIIHANDNVTLRNCLIRDAGQLPMSAGINSGAACTVTLQNCTVVNCWRNIWLGGAGVEVTCTNVLCDNSDGADFSIDNTSGQNTGQVTYCASSDATADDLPGGSGNRTNQTFTYASASYHLDDADTGALGVGTDLSGTFTVDIDNETRSLWSIGADDGPAATLDVSGTLAGASGLSGAASVVRDLAGTLAAASGLSGALTGGDQPYLSGALTASATLTASLSRVGPVDLAGAVAAFSTLAGALTVPEIDTEIPPAMLADMILPNTSGTWLWLCEFVVPTQTTRHLARNTVGVFYAGQAYEEFNFDVGRQPFNGDGSIPRVTLRISNVNQQMERIINATQGALGGEVKLIRVNSQFLTNPITALEYDYQVLAAQSDRKWVTFQLGIPNPLTQAALLRDYSCGMCPYATPELYRGVECGYTGLAITDITHSATGYPVNVWAVTYGHYFSTGDQISLEGATGITPSPDGIYTITVGSGVHFSLDGTDGGDYEGTYGGGAVAAYTDCDGSIEACRKRNNASRYGAEPGLDPSVTRV